MKLRRLNDCGTLTNLIFLPLQSIMADSSSSVSRLPLPHDYVSVCALSRSACTVTLHRLSAWTGHVRLSRDRKAMTQTGIDED